MSLVSNFYFNDDRSGGEINILNIPYVNIVGYISITNDEVNRINDNDVQQSLKTRMIQLNPDYIPSQNLINLLNSNL